MTDQEQNGCLYIFGDLKSREPWHYCGAPRQEDSSYCDHHHAICYNKLRRRVRVESGEVTTTYLTDSLDDAA